MFYHRVCLDFLKHPPSTVRRPPHLSNFHRQPSHRRNLFRNLLTSLVKHDQIITTITKANVLRPMADRIVTLACRGGPRNEARLREILTESYVVEKLMADFPYRFALRGEYFARVTPLLSRDPDNASVRALIEYVDKDKAFDNLYPPQAQYHQSLMPDKILDRKRGGRWPDVALDTDYVMQPRRMESKRFRGWDIKDDDRPAQEGKSRMKGKLQGSYRLPKPAPQPAEQVLDEYSLYRK
eukprot:NODE_4155_length_834_cov_24.394625_g3997_i0.p1 GENE.NODE_4155_length_834_cov_24.394625_g3997_i0~~NODE_4155_length_834_cov_24.394625_g3997_i0.p1  ORF type:complete len:258 (+),score=49.22 NODE_4155_length_834_cov_24.394625_g3997_i0:59-775(+)